MKRFMANLIFYILLTVSFCWVSSSVYASDNENEILNQCIYSKSTFEQHKAFNVITANPTKYVNNILTRLQSYSSEANTTPDTLFYLTAVIKDQRYIKYLANLISNTDYSEEHCIYSCPVVFSLVIFGSFTNYSLPSLNDQQATVRDLKSEIKKAKSISLKSEEASKYMAGPAVDDLLKKLEALPITDVIKLAGPETLDGNKRIAAAVVLKSHVTNDKYINELYWLAITGLPNDSSGEYRNAIHSAIFRAEKYRMMEKARNKWGKEGQPLKKE